ncbi:MAG: hypothetical protein LBQ57_08170 [Spirochaetales bacterium]|jgi:hypothetical protein|nr:hypothetical protein [Spirochaetales bacterium]
MNKKLMGSVFFIFSAFSLFAQVPANWEASPPADTAAVKYAVGISLPLASEQDAYKSAWNNALQNMASSIGTHVRGESEITVRSSGYDSGIEDAFTVSVETSSFSVQVRLSGVREAARKTRQEGGGCVAYVLAAINGEDYAKAVRYMENEEASFLAYRFFAQKVPAITPLDGSGRPQAYPDFYSWLRNDCVTLSLNTAENPAPYLAQLDIFAKKLYRNCSVFAENLEGGPARIIYDAPRYHDGLYKALSGMGIFSVSRENSRLVLAPQKSGGLAAFRAAVTNMKDSSKIFVTGVEVIQMEKGNVVNTGNLVINQFKTLAAKRFGMNAVNYSLPARFTGGGEIDEDGLIAYIRANIAAFPARYAAVCYAQTILEPGMPEYSIGPRAGASCRFTLYDVVTGEVFHSDTSATNAIFTLADTREQTILNESRAALHYLYDVKNQPGLAEIMAAVFEKL